MINDRTIDINSATYWCAFNDKDLEKQLKTATSFSKEDGKRLHGVFKSVEDGAEKAKTESLKETKGPLDGKSFWDNFMNPQNMVGMTGNPFCPNFRKDAPLSLEEQGKNSVIAAGVAAAAVGAVAAPGTWGMLGSAIMGVIHGSAVLSSIVAQVGLAGLSAGVTALVGGIVSISAYLYPRIAKWLKDINRDDYLACCKFTADEVPYQAVYSLDTKKWELLYDNNRWIRSGTKVPPADVDSFFATEFFKKFLDRCKEILGVIVDKPQNVECLKTLATMSDKDSAKVIMKFVQAVPEVKSSMFRGIYKT